MALDSISFDVQRGETVGIIGLNGSGKSTLLQLIAGTLTPTKGEIFINGKVSALLELGAGFNTEFTGRENIYLAASIAGLTSLELEQRYDRIAAYADIGGYRPACEDVFERMYAACIRGSDIGRTRCADYRRGARGRRYGVSRSGM